MSRKNIQPLMFSLYLFFQLSLVFADTARADSVFNTERKITKLADGIYTIRHKDPFRGFVNGNTTVIIGDRDVFVGTPAHLNRPR